MAQEERHSDGGLHHDAPQTEAEYERPAARDHLAESAAGATLLLGPERYVQLGFAVAAVATFAVLNKAIRWIWNYFSEPNDRIVIPTAFLVSVGAVIALYRHSKVHQLASEVVQELQKVTWPTREETSSHTLVVIVTSVIAAILLGAFDTIWSALTDLVYTI